MKSKEITVCNFGCSFRPIHINRVVENSNSCSVINERFRRRCYADDIHGNFTISWSENHGGEKLQSRILI